MPAIEQLQIQYDTEEAACQRAQRRIENGGLIGSLVGRFQRWLHIGELERVTEELDIAELYEHLDRERSAQAQ
ncbi:MAG TPA: hypothetical protein VK712_03740 [Verrucomicrobiae bacterium]|nr:hypothetical protein [Verrucomicrobiae bacterium]